MKLQKLCVPFLGLILAAALLVGIASASASPTPERESCNELISTVYGNIELEAVAAISDYLAADDFGGLYRNEQGEIVVNVVDLDKNLNAQTAIMQSGAGDQVIFAPVKYPLAMLEDAVDQLIPYMETFHILTLDANDQTNWLDICLSDYSEENLSELAAVIESLSIPADCVNYIDCTGQTNQLTAGSGG